MKKLRPPKLLASVLSVVLLISSTVSPAIAATAPFKYRVPLKTGVTNPTGPGTDPGEVPPIAGGPPLAKFVLSEPKLTLTSVSGTSQARTVTLQNVGAGDGTSGPVKLNLGVPGLSFASRCDNKVLKPSDTCSVDVTYDGVKAGSFRQSSLVLGGLALPVEVDVSANPATARVQSVSSDIASVPASAALSSDISVLVTDANGNVLGAGMPVVLSTSFGTLSKTSGVTAANGIFTSQISAAAPGTIVITASAATGSAKTLTLPVSGNPATSTISSIVGAPAFNWADGESPIVAKVSLKDSAGYKLGAGAPVTWTTNFGSIATPVTYSDANGDASVVVLSTVRGTGTVTAKTVTGSTKALNITFQPNPATVKIYSFVSSLPALPADGTTLTTLTVNIRDGLGNVLPTQIVRLSTTLGTLMKTYGGTDTSGNVTSTMKCSTVGTALVTITIDGSSVYGTLPVKCIIPPATTHVASFTVSDTTAVADGKSTILLTATVVDANGAPYLNAGARVNWNVITGSGTLVGATNTDERGIATATYTAPKTTSTPVIRLRATGQNAPALDNLITLVGDSATARAYQVGASGSPKADGIAFANVNAVVRDANNNSVAGVRVFFTTNFGELSAESAVSNDLGIATVTIKSSVIGVARVYGDTRNGTTTSYGNVSFVK